MTLVGAGRPGVRQKERLLRESCLPTRFGAPLGHPGALAPRPPKASLRSLGCSPGAPAPEDPSVAVLCPRVATARRRTSSPHLCRPAPFASLEVVSVGVRAPKSPKRKASQSFLGPKTKCLSPRRTSYLFSTLRSASVSPTPEQTLPEKGRVEKWSETGIRAAPQTARGCASPAASPAQPCAAERDVGSAGPGPLARPRH